MRKMTINIVSDNEALLYNGVDGIDIKITPKKTLDENGTMEFSFSSHFTLSGQRFMSGHFVKGNGDVRILNDRALHIYTLTNTSSFSIYDNANLDDSPLYHLQNMLKGFFVSGEYKASDFAKPDPLHAELQSLHEQERHVKARIASRNRYGFNSRF